MTRGIQYLTELPFLSNMNDLYHTLEKAGYMVVCNAPGDGDCFYAAAAFQLDVETEKVKNMVFNHLLNHRYDVSTTATIQQNNLE